MKSKSPIKSFIALFLLSVFTLGITPKKTLHSLLANHKDNTTKPGDGKTLQLSKAGFNCKCDNLVAESGFIAAPLFKVSNRIIYLSYINFHRSSFHCQPHFFFDRRGPPANFQS